MKMYEHQAKDVFRKYGIPLAQGGVATTPEEAARIAGELNKPVVIKAQVLAGGRGKAGAVKFADTPEEAKQVASEILSMDVKGMKVEKVLVEEKLDIASEIYVGITVDRVKRMALVIASAVGGMNIEEVAASTPDKIVRHYINPAHGLYDFECRNIAKRIGLSEKQMNTTARIISALYRIYEDYDVELTEINPLAILSDGSVMAVDARLNVDDNALFRHPELREQASAGMDELSPLERRAKESGLVYVELDGDVGIIGNGAGLVMATLDVVQLFGGSPANFCDLGGGASPETTAEAIELVLSNPKVKVLFINVLAGITRCDEVAIGMLKTMEKVQAKTPMVVRMIGTNEEEGRRILTGAGIDVMDAMEPAAKRVVELLGGA